ncbi:hypothetical protein DN069_14570 [Streptacidiphilus pinicola]|uniref:Uncharacterized protein n=1 Tax=Streptacidiphilus pinicola TaxID=2219663 RepID=A0A2X0IMV8_9ACTN|nr:hypothetical protein [Streptacidiphilus pinicola]RAG84873.1 hypothetical protein DN069_14570 [Streptacidiphilus pinicola]
MPRLTVSQLALGTLAVVGATVALLALSGTQSTPLILLLALLGLAVGVVAALRRSRPRGAPGGSRVVAKAQAPAPAVESIPERERVPH